MKELYISPELEILCFAPVQGIANSWTPYALTEHGGLSTEAPSVDGDHEIPLGGGIN